MNETIWFESEDSLEEAVSHLFEKNSDGFLDQVEEHAETDGLRGALALVVRFYRDHGAGKMAKANTVTEGGAAAFRHTIDFTRMTTVTEVIDGETYELTVEEKVEYLITVSTIEPDTLAEIESSYELKARY